MVGIMCFYCREDINEKNQDNMSDEAEYPKCEECYYGKPKLGYKSNYGSYKSNYGSWKKSGNAGGGNKHNAGGGNKHNAGCKGYSDIYNYIHGNIKPY